MLAESFAAHLEKEPVRISNIEQGHGTRPAELLTKSGTEGSTRSLYIVPTPNSSVSNGAKYGTEKVILFVFFLLTCQVDIRARVVQPPPII